MVQSTAMNKRTTAGWGIRLPAPSVADQADLDPSPKLQGLDSNPNGDFGPQFWQVFRDTFAHVYTLSLPDPSEEARFTLSTHTYHTPRAILMRSDGTAFIIDGVKPGHAAAKLAAAMIA